MRGGLTILALIGLLFFEVSSAYGDSWAPAETQVFYSRAGDVRLTVIPHDIGSPLEYFGDSRAHDGRARGLLERRNTSGDWHAVWNRSLLNDVAPVSALVGAGGRYVVTFDDWHFIGTREHVVVVYDQSGLPLWSLSLTDILPDFYVRALPRSVSSIDWGGEHRLSSNLESLVLQITVPEGANHYVELRLDLANGRITPQDNEEWQAALNTARRVAQSLDASHAAAEAAFLAPLQPPMTTDERDWHRFLLEAFFRLDSHWLDDYPAIKVLRSPSAHDYGVSRRRLCDALSEAHDALMIASPAAPQNLLQELPLCLSQTPANDLRNTRVYIAAPDELQEQIRALLLRTGAQVTFLGPNISIPQRQERIDRRRAQ